MMQKNACFCGCHGHFPTPEQLIYKSSSRPHTHAMGGGGHDDGTVLAKPRLVLCNPIGRSCRQELELWSAWVKLENLGRFKMNKGGGD